MSIQVQSIFRLCKWANATCPIRRLLLSGFPLVLTTRYFGMRSDLTRSEKNSNRARSSPKAYRQSGLDLRRQKNFTGIRIFHRRSRGEAAHIDVTGIWRE